MKKANLFLAVIIVLLLLFSSIALAQSITAIPTLSLVYVEGVQISFDAYNIAGNNYFKLRDLAYALRGTAKQFSVDWNTTANAISLQSGMPYKPLGGEMIGGTGNSNMEAIPAIFATYLDSKEIAVNVYIIGGNSYFKLRDLGQALNFNVDWDNKVRCIRIEPDQAYMPIYGENGQETAKFNSEEYVQEVVRLINDERIKEGLAPLTADNRISDAAQIRAQELQKKWGHIRPGGGFYYTVFEELNISYYSCCENIAAGQDSPQSVVQSWLDSTGHRANIMGSYNKIGVGVFEIDGYYYWEQLLVLEKTIY